MGTKESRSTLQEERYEKVRSVKHHHVINGLVNQINNSYFWMNLLLPITLAIREKTFSFY